MGVGDSKISLAEQMTLQKKHISRSIREIERERTRLVMQEKKLIADIKTIASKGQTGPLKVQTRDLVRNRGYQNKMTVAKSHMQGLELRMQTMKSSDAMMRSMQSMGRIMRQMNSAIDLPGISRMSAQFLAEMDRFGETEEAMGEAMDEGLAFEGEDEETEQVMEQVLTELGIDAALLSGSVPTGQVDTAQAVTAAPADNSELEARLNALKR